MSLFTRKHYVFLANAIAEDVLTNRQLHDTQYTTSTSFLRLLCKLLEKDNPAFDKYRFVKAAQKHNPPVDAYQSKQPPKPKHPLKKKGATIVAKFDKNNKLVDCTLSKENN